MIAGFRFSIWDAEGFVVPTTAKHKGGIFLIFADKKLI